MTGGTPPERWASHRFPMPHGVPGGSFTHARLNAAFRALRGGAGMATLLKTDAVEAMTSGGTEANTACPARWR